MAATLNIGTVDMIEPTKYDVVAYDGDSESTTRTATWRLIRTRVKADIYKISVTWRCTWAELEAICTAISPATFTVVFLDPTQATSTTKTMYSGDRSSSLVKLVDTATPADSLWDFSVSLIDTCDT